MNDLKLKENNSISMKQLLIFLCIAALHDGVSSDEKIVIEKSSGLPSSTKEQVASDENRTKLVQM